MGKLGDWIDSVSHWFLSFDTADGVLELNVFNCVFSLKSLLS